MRVKMLIAIAISGLISATAAYADMSGASVSGAAVPSSGVMSGTNTSGGMSGNMGADQNNVAPPSGDATTGNSNDDMSADTATGDDDY